MKDSEDQPHAGLVRVVCPVCGGTGHVVEPVEPAECACYPLPDGQIISKDCRLHGRAR